MSRNYLEYKRCKYCGKLIMRKIGENYYPVGKGSNLQYCSRECYGKQTSKDHPNKKKDRLFHVWKGMRERCEYSNHASAKFYQNRGIEVCEEWDNDFLKFKEWALANGYDYTKTRKEQSLDRIDNNKGYSPDNCRWVSMKTNNQNTRRNVFLTYDNKTLCISDWSRELGISIETIRSRIKKGYPVEVILSKERLKRQTVPYIND